MDMTASIEPRSDQINADDLIPGPMTVTITDVTAGNAEQPVNVVLAETPGRPYKPSKSMRRVMVAGWGKDSSVYVGRRLTLFRNPDITFGRDAVGGIQISHMSHISEPLKVSLTVKRGKRQPFTVNRLPDAPAQGDWQARLTQVQGDPDAARELYDQARAAGAPNEYLEAVQAAGKQGEQQ